MDWDKIIQEASDRYMKPYLMAKRNVEFINDCLAGNGVITKLTDYQENYMLESALNDVVVVHKCRQAGYTTLLLAQAFCKLWFKYMSDPLGTRNDTKILFVSPNAQMSVDAKEKFLRLVANVKFPENDSNVLLPLMIEERMQMVRSRIVFAHPGNVHNKLCGSVYTDAYFDEFAFIQNLSDIYTCFFASAKNPKAVFATSFDDKNKHEVLRITDNLVSHGAKFIDTHWYEIPKFNKNLVWKKYQVEPTIDEEGNIKYDKKHFDKMISDGWIPTSPTYEKMSEMIGPDKAKEELLN